MRLARELRRRLRRDRPCILMYHRVQAVSFDPWGLAVSPENFRAQLRQLVRSRTILPLRAFVAAHAEGSLPDKAVAITFDDGYLDNLTEAAPALRAFEAPATLFLATGPMAGGGHYWWDELAGLVFAPAALQGSIRVGAGRQTVALAPLAAADRPPKTWRAWHDGGHDGATPRQALHFHLWQALRALPAAAVGATLADLRALGAVATFDQGQRPMSRAEVDRLSTDTTFSIEGHTVDHPDLPSQPDGEIGAQVQDGALTIRALTGQDVTGFAYPYGRFDRRVQAAVDAAGVRWACTTEGRWVGSGCDPLALPRLAAVDRPDIDWVGDASRP